MPFRAKRPCRGGCGELVERGYCNACRLSGKAAEKKPEWHELYDARWQRESKAYLAANPIAVDLFGMHGGRAMPAEEVDHIIPHRGDRKLFWDPANWQGLTKRDHSRKTALEQRGLTVEGRGSKISGNLGS